LGRKESSWENERSLHSAPGDWGRCIGSEVKSQWWCYDPQRETKGFSGSNPALG
jgi:hypothetical protein